MEISDSEVVQKLFEDSDSLKQDFEEKSEIGERFLIVNSSPSLRSLLTRTQSSDGEYDAKDGLISDKLKDGLVSDKLRAEGNTLFQAGQFRKAAEKFSQAAMKVIEIASEQVFTCFKVKLNHVFTFFWGAGNVGKCGEMWAHCLF